LYLAGAARVRIQETGAQRRTDRACMPARLAINFVLVLDKAERKREIMAAELQRYFGETCPALTARWEAAITRLAPPALRDLASR
jgi:hypothetical protein